MATTSAAPQLSASPSPTTYEEAARQLIEDLSSGRTAEAFRRFGPETAALLSEAKLRAIWEQLLADGGAWQKVESVESEPTPQGEAFDLQAKFANKAFVLHVILNAQRKVVGFGNMGPPWAAPDYASADAFDERPVTVTDGDVSLPGLLCVPKGKGPFPAVVLVHGSGPGDADETTGTNKPLKDLAWGLASQNVAVLRYVKRTRQYRGARAYPTIGEESLDDVTSALNLLGKTPGIDPKRMIVAGHSLGAELAPRIAAADPRVSAIVLLAGPTRPIGQVWIDQHKYLVGVSGLSGESAEKVIRDAEVVGRRLDATDLTPDETVLGIPGRYWLDLRENHGLKFAPKLKIPILVLQGERDYQVTMEDFAGWKKALSGKPNATLKTYPRLNHLFQEGTGKSEPKEYYLPANHVAKDVIDDVARWIASH
jgi:dienelactone hydrolase